MDICSEDIYDLHVPHSNNDIIVLIHLFKKYFLKAIPESYFKCQVVLQSTTHSFRIYKAQIHWLLICAVTADKSGIILIPDSLCMTCFFLSFSFFPSLEILRSSLNPWMFWSFPKGLSVFCFYSFCWSPSGPLNLETHVWFLGIFLMLFLWQFSSEYFYILSFWNSCYSDDATMASVLVRILQRNRTNRTIRVCIDVHVHTHSLTHAHI